MLNKILIGVILFLLLLLVFKSCQIDLLKKQEQISTQEVKKANTKATTFEKRWQTKFKEAKHEKTEINTTIGTHTIGF